MESRLLGMRNGDRGERLGVRQGVRDVCESRSGYLATVLASGKLHTEQNCLANRGRKINGASCNESALSSLIRELSNSNQA